MEPNYWMVHFPRQPGSFNMHGYWEEYVKLHATVCSFCGAEFAALTKADARRLVEAHISKCPFVKLGSKVHWPKEKELPETPPF